MLSQASLAATILASTAGTFIALSPPNPSSNDASLASDWVRSIGLTRKHATKIALAPLGLLSLHASSLACLYPNLPPTLVRYGVQNGLNTNLITWSSATAVPLALILCAGIPLRLIAYSSLGHNFTFALAEPDRLVTTGIHSYLQHPSYTGIVILGICNMALLARLDGVLSCWLPPKWHDILQSMESGILVVGLSIMVLGLIARVRQEERLLRGKFGVEWERWHAKTARFVPWLF